MTRADELVRENRALRARLSRLSEASLRINESLDLETVLQGVLDSARSLTGARYGVITTVGKSGQLEGFLSSGLSDGELQRLGEGQEGTRLFEYFSRLEEPLRVGDFRGYLRSEGLPDFRSLAVSSFLAAPIRHRGEGAGYIHLGKQEPGQVFAPEDEEALVMFASQAALVIANARTHREEQRARTDLETVINTAPVGVLVFDTKTRAPVSVNQEARRIFGGLRTPGQSAEQLTEAVSVRRADGSEINLRESPLAEVLDAGEPVRAEKVVIEAPGGRSAAVLVNATPILSEEGRVESVVVAVQDMAPLEELERLRAEFLATVSHELRAPLSSIKGSAATLLDPSASLGTSETRQFHRIIDSQADRMRELISDLLDAARIETGTLSVSPEPTDVAVLVEEARNTFQSGGDSNSLRVGLAPGLPWVMADRRRIVQVLNNLLANAARHSPQSSPVHVGAARDGTHVAVSVADAGEGVPEERLPHLFKTFSGPGGDASGSGLGLAICKGIVEAHGGRIRAESDGPGLGARFTFTIPAAEEARYTTPARPRQTLENQPRILAVDDDPQTLQYIRDALTGAGYQPIATSDPKEALHLTAREKPQLVLLDLMLPGTDGIELMKQIQDTADLPVIFVSAYGQDETIAQAIDTGADDYIVKPFSPTELAARIRAALRKRETPEPTQPYTLGDLTINYTERRVTLAGRPVPVTAIEYRTLAELSTNPGRTLTYQQLLRQVWGHDHTNDLRPMRTAISSLRRKLQDNTQNPTYIHTEPRVGYRMPKPETPEQTEQSP